MVRGHNTAADNWALGVLAYEMVAGYHPFLEDADMDNVELFRSIAQGNYPALPSDISLEVTDLLARVIVVDPLHRLCAKEILEHAWFNDLSANAMRRRKLAAPWVPTITDPLDMSSFEDWSELEDKTTARYPPLGAKDAELFKTF